MSQPQEQTIDDVEAQKIKKPEYLDEAIFNVRACLPCMCFKRLPCIHCSCFSAIFACVVGCILGCLKCGVGCFASCYKCVFACLACPCKCCLGCLKKLNCCNACPCKCPCTCCFGCLKKLNCCNVECGLPCCSLPFCSPPGCVCIFPCKLCGYGLTCPYFCCSCGTKHCLKMPKEEQNYWFSLKSAPGMQTMKKGEKETLDLEALQNENARLRQQIEELQHKC